MKVFILLSFAAVAFATRDCGENSHYESCGTACPLTCKNYENPPKVCVLMCNPGCHCDKGYVKTEDGRCVLPEECPAQIEQASPFECGENEHFEGCGTACPLTCKNYQNPPKFCVKMCKIGCQCDKGYVRDDDGRCVKPEECAAETEEVCGENQVYATCGTACPLTCDNYQNPPKICTMQCVIGCQCEEGFVKTHDGKCVRPEECPASTPEQKSCVGEAESGVCDAYFLMWYYDVKSQTCKQFVYGGCGGNGNRYKTEEECMDRCGEKCGENQVYTTCGTACPLTCDNYQNPPKMCTMQCVIGCQCEKGFVKTKDGRCVRPEECPASAPEQKSCVGEAETGLCRAYFPSWYYDVKSGSCKQFVYGGCGGNGNRYRTEKECMDNCGEKCGENQVYTTCGTACPLTCDNYQNPPKVCTLQCLIGCQCEKGFVKTRDGTCVRPEKCPAIAPEQKSCVGEAETGLCRAYMPSWYYDVKSESCKEFIYGGCGGNGNRYRTEKECMDNCGGNSV